MDMLTKLAGIVGGLIKLPAGLSSVFAGIVNVSAIVAAVLATGWFVKSQIAETATANANARCEVRVAAIQSTQSTEAENRVEAADDAAEAVAGADTRADLRRVCQGDPACRDRPN